MLRPYQIELIEKAREAYRHGARAPCIVLPCGGGKSVIVADIAKSSAEKGNQVLFLVHRKELVEQIKRTFEWWGVDMSKCNVMMVQTASRRISRLPAPDLIITDENHHSKASTYRKVYNAFPNAKRIGVTATPIRLDGSGLRDVNDALVVGVSAKWLIEHHYLAPYDYYAPSIADLTGIKIQHGEYETKSVEKAMLKTAVFGDAIKYYRQLADGKQAICYCVSVNHSMAMSEEFRIAGISAEHIDGTTPKDERERIIADFRKGKIKILCNVDLISEGFDVPDCECAILLRPTKSLTLYIQQSMRCMRYKKGKRAIIIDHVGNYARFGMPDADREWSLDGRKKSENKRDVDDEVKVTQCPECFYTFEPPKFGRSVCPACGYIFPKKERTLDTEEDTKLEKITGFTLDFSSPDECKNMQELQAYAKKHGYPLEFDMVQEEFLRRENAGKQYSSTSIFASKMICGDCGSYFGAKVWHSNSKYRRVIYQCNSKFKGEHFCTTPHLYESEIQQKFLNAFSRYFEQRDVVIRNCQFVLNQLKMQDEHNAELQTEFEEINEKLKRYITSGGTDSDYSELNARYEKVAAQINAEEQLAVERKGRIAKMQEILRVLKKSDSILETFDENIWTALVETLTVFHDGSMVFLFKDGTEVKI